MWLRTEWRGGGTLKAPAFTLAEVLVTLGIIGVVSAMTLPALINDTQDKQHIAMWKKKYSEISNVYNLVKDEMGLRNYCVSKSDFTTSVKCLRPGEPAYEVTNGDTVAKRLTLSPEFVERFVKHLKVIDSCGRPEYGETKLCENYYVKWYGACGNSNVGYYASLKQGRGSVGKNASTSCSPSAGLYTGWEIYNKAVLLADGSVVYFGGHTTGWISVDVNGFTKGPNAVGRDFFAVLVNEDWAKPLGADGTYSKAANGNENCECSKDSGIESAQGFLGSSDLLNGKIISGGCCSATYLYQ